MSYSYAVYSSWSNIKKKKKKKKLNRFYCGILDLMVSMEECKVCFSRRKEHDDECISNGIRFSYSNPRQVAPFCLMKNKFRTIENHIR